MTNAMEMSIVIDQWLQEIYAMDDGNLSPEEIATSLQSICAEFGIPEDVCKRAVFRALHEDSPEPETVSN